jgi:light-regulated signal transduction histidine kinase (bacteriophytochrome)
MSAVRFMAFAAQQSAELARSNSELEQFAYIATHDLQEPLRMVGSYVQLLERNYKNLFDAKGEEYIAYAVDGAKRMQMLINDLLSYSRVGTQRNEFALTDCAGVVGLAIKNLQKAIQESGATITCDPLPTVLADRSTKTHGTGMGLRISRSIVESHGGRLWADDNPPRGARFCLTLPTSNDPAVSGASTEAADDPHANNPVA